MNELGLGIPTSEGKELYDLYLHSTAATRGKMSVERLDAIQLQEADRCKSSNVNPLVLRLQQTLASCSESIEAGSEESISELVDFLNSVSDSTVSESENEDLENNAFEVICEVHRHVSSPSLDQAVMDALSFELPKAAARFACASSRCLQVAESVNDIFVASCSPRDMLSILCEALGSPTKIFKVPRYFAPLLSGLAKVFVSLQRRQFEQVKAAVPVILNVLKAMSSESDDEDTDCQDLFSKAIGIANSIQDVCVKLVDKENKKLRALFGLFVFQIMALVSISMRDNLSTCLPVVLQLSNFLRNCDLSCLGLITGSDVDTFISIAIGDDEDDCFSSFSYVKHGASLAVIWGHMFNEVAVAANMDLATVKDELQTNQTKRWQAVGMLKHIFSCVTLPWELKKHAIDFLLCFMDENLSHRCHDEHTDYSLHMPSLYSALQAVEMVIIYASDAVLRKNAFDAFKRVLADVPTSLRFDILIALIKNSDSSSMIAILLDCVKEQLHIENCQRISTGGDGFLQAENKAGQSRWFWSAGVLEVVEFVLRPPKGGPPSLPEYSDAVLSALNLYRYILITESTANTARTAEIMARYRPIAPRPMTPTNENPSLSQKIRLSPYLRSVWPHLQVRSTRTRKRGRTAITPPTIKRPRTYLQGFSPSCQGKPTTLECCPVTTYRRFTMDGFYLCALW